MLLIYYITFVVLSLVLAEGQQSTEDDPFSFDYHRLRVGGLILAAVLCLIGITILLSGHCRCKFNQDKRRRTGSNAQAMLNDTGMTAIIYLCSLQPINRNMRPVLV
ncbi:Phospholemman [Labeo rohita]|uniref:FXYD domain-containing ion transport regulator n=1 Tax=Labeo rohita TaxID=84645 RepID=A0ABQ8LY90_LABRO|nr:Phospholemman [Labeo rohita]